MRDEEFTKVVRLGESLPEDERLGVAEWLLRDVGVARQPVGGDVERIVVKAVAATMSRSERLELADQLISVRVPERKPEAEDPDADFKAWYEALSRQVEREDGLVDQRLRWMMTFEALLFAGVGYMTKETSRFVVALMVIFAASGIVVALISRNALLAAYGALDDLKTSYFTISPRKRQQLIRPFGGRVWHHRGKLLASHLPDVVIGIWILIIALGFVFSSELLKKDDKLGPAPVTLQCKKAAKD